MAGSHESFDRLIAEAVEAPFAGWDFSYLDGRRTEVALPWDYGARVRAAISDANSLLDMGTGGGEVLAALAPLPPSAYATEAYPPNIPVARERLGPLGVTVVDTRGGRGEPAPAVRGRPVRPDHQQARLLGRS